MPEPPSEQSLCYAPRGLCQCLGNEFPANCHVIRRFVPRLAESVSMSLSAHHLADDDRASIATLPLGVGVGVFGLLLIAGNRLLVDPDTFWQVAIGRWIAENRAVPVTDVFSFTMHGQPWISTQWLAQVMFAQADAVWGWNGIVVLTSLSIALTFGLLARFLNNRLSDVATLILLSLAFVIALPHLLARPHALALPVMVAWVAVMLSASERREAPSLPFVALMALWANLHGSFVFGLMLIAPIALDAVLSAGPRARKQLVMRWATFAFFAVIASFATPYGWNSLFAARNILALGEALTLIREWTPASFATFSPFEGVILAALGLALYKGVTFPPMRIVLLLGLLHMALAHVRNADVFALLTPMMMAAPLAAHFGRRGEIRTAPQSLAFAVLAMAAVGLTAGVPSIVRYAPAKEIAPELAATALKQTNAQRVFNDYDFGGYLISRGVKTYIDGRTELYGEHFMVQHNRASALQKPAEFFELLDAYKIDATFLRTQTAGAQLLDLVEGWQKVYGDDIAVVHIRKLGARTVMPLEIRPALN